MTLQDIAPPTDRPWNADDETAFETDLVTLMPHLRRFSRSLTRKSELAEDMAQSALTKAWQSRRLYAPGSNLKAWLFTILRHEFYSYYRSAWRQVPWDAVLADMMPAPHDEQQWVVELNDTAHAMQALPQTQREALILVGVGGFSYRDAAELSKSAVGTVKSRVGRARHALNETLESKAPLSAKSRSGRDGAIKKILAQLSQLRQTGSHSLAIGTA